MRGERVKPSIPPPSLENNRTSQGWEGIMSKQIQALIISNQNEAKNFSEFKITKNK